MYLAEKGIVPPKEFCHDPNVIHYHGLHAKQEMNSFLKENKKYKKEKMRKNKNWRI